MHESRLVRSEKMPKKPRIIIASTPKTSFFAIEMEDAQDIHPPKWIRLQAMAGQPQESGNEPTTWVPPPPGMDKQEDDNQYFSIHDPERLKTRGCN